MKLKLTVPQPLLNLRLPNAWIRRIELMQKDSRTVQKLRTLRTSATRVVQRHPRVFVGAVALMSVALWVASASTLLLAREVVGGIPGRAAVALITEMARTSTLYDAKDRTAFTIFKEQRLEIPLEAMSPHLVKAIIAIEDQRFYDHEGIDVVRVVGAAFANIREGRRAQGGSTITQQLARQTLLTAAKTYVRKAQEVVLATLIEAEYTKDEILELYLNKVYFGAGLYGAEAASLGFFGKHASELSVAEAALLAGLVKSPSTWAPTVNLDRAVQRRDLVLDEMRDSGVIDEAAWTEARAEKVVLIDALGKEEPFGQYFKEQVRLELVERFGHERVYVGGLRVFTTVDLDMQRAAEAEVQKSLKSIEDRRAANVRRRGAPPAAGAPLQAALIALDPNTGEVRALVGGRDFAATKFNRALQARRQPGSAFKPFVYAAALEAGFTPASLIERLDEPIQTLQGDWVPEDGHSDATELTMRAALKMSSNRAAVRMLEDVGIAKAVAYAERLGVGSMPSVPSLALGSGEVTLESLTSAYAVFASGGIRRPATFIRRVEDADGKVLYSAPVEEERVITPASAFLMSQMMADVINSGTAWKARELGFRLPAAGKTGTTNDYHDAWFVGYTPSLVTGVWVGFDQPQTIVSGGYAAELAVPLWAGFMRESTKNDKPVWFRAPEDIITVSVCRLSGRRPAEGCEHVDLVKSDGSTETRSTIYTEYFVRGTEPQDTCPFHLGRSIFGRMAGWFGASPDVAPQRSNDAAVPAAQDPTAAPADTAAPATESVDAPKPEKKRGFWSRVFGRGKDKPQDNKDKKPKPF
jgi:1A family penicillin-binding protein